MKRLEKLKLWFSKSTSIESKADNLSRSNWLPLLIKNSTNVNMWFQTVWLFQFKFGDIFIALYLKWLIGFENKPRRISTNATSCGRAFVLSPFGINSIDAKRQAITNQSNICLILAKCFLLRSLSLMTYSFMYSLFRIRLSSHLFWSLLCIEHFF